MRRLEIRQVEDSGSGSSPQIGRARSVKAVKNIAASILIKGTSIGLSLILVPLTLKYLDATEYGIWLTLNSIIGWISFFDIGLTNGLRNKLTEAIAKDDMKLGRIYVSTTYALLCLIMGAILAIFLALNPFLNWSRLLNAAPSYALNLSWVALIVFVCFCVSFIFKLVGIVFIADQLPAFNDLLGLIGYVLSFIIIFVLVKSTPGSLINVAATFSAVPALVMIVAHFIVFSRKYSYLKPSLRSVQFRYSRDLMGLGVKYFLVQISSLMVFAISNAMIAQLYGPEQVTTYNIAFKFFNLIVMGFSILVSPLWSASTDALARNDIAWIKRTIKRMLFIWIFVVAAVLAMIPAADIFYRFWVGDEIQVPFLVNCVCGLYCVIFCWNSIFSFIIAGSGKMIISSIISIFNIIAYIPLAIGLSKLIGISGVLLATCIILLGGAIQTPIQTYFILNNKAVGIWNK
jgi:O-antigen/teichoic acid export membrane protein